MTISPPVSCFREGDGAACDDCRRQAATDKSASVRRNNPDSLGSELTFTDATGRPAVDPKFPGTRRDGGPLQNTPL